ncbi:MFS transporter [Paremcibacter congregatus]|uniref:MFS transporter n=1 Tax=Paremcibacter congregatus TaxID=2043170 RepID=A0A2G4YS49_9PROT|nr:MFS transporter [Paremcibacter congregatus]PHZ85148.1 hypothetical protein CRD36_06965 [Paremcibacter congregatus]QDE27916.1 MFS transporter [Paremcibacter congregatus]
MPHTSPPLSNKLTWRNRIGYGSGDYALNLFWQGAGFYLFFYYTDVLGLPTVTAGMIFAIGGIWDALSDPIMGYIAERTKSRWGIYRPYLIFGAIPLALSFILLFTPPAIDGETLRVIYILIVLLVFRTCYTVVSIPYSALSARLTHDSKERTRISGIRMYCGFLGGLSVIGLSALLQETFTDRVAFTTLACLCAFLSVGALYYCFRNTREEILGDHNSRPASSIRQIISSLLKNKPFLLLFAAIMMVTVANTALGKLLLFYFEYDLQDRLAGNTAILIMTGAPLITIPLWSAIALRHGKRRTWIYGCLFAGGGFTLLYFDRSKSISFALMEFGVITTGLSAFAVLLWSMLPDTIDYGEYQTGVRNESTVVGILSSAQKASLAGTAFMLGVALDHIGYRAGQPQSTDTLDGLNSLISLVPLFALIASLVIISFYGLSGKILGELRQNRMLPAVPPGNL